MPAIDEHHAKLFLDINGLSDHLNTNKDYNQRNPGLGLTYQTGLEGISSLSGGFYKNSDNETSIYLMKGLAKRFGDQSAYVDLGGLAGLLTGYKGSKARLMAALTGTIGNKNSAMRLMYAPKTNKTPAIFTLNYELPIK